MTTSRGKHMQRPSRTEAATNGRRPLNVRSGGTPRGTQPGVVFLCGNEFDTVTEN
jgi:hypothetical protein